MADGAVWVYGESREGQPTPVTLELVSRAAELGETSSSVTGVGCPWRLSP